MLLVVLVVLLLIIVAGLTSVVLDNNSNLTLALNIKSDFRNLGDRKISS